MAKGFFVPKTLGILGIVLCVAAVCTIIALSVVYTQEKNKNAASSTAASTSPPTSPSTTAATTLDQSQPWNRYRLPQTLAPESYNVTLRPYLTPNEQGLYIFTGSSTVRFTCNEPTDVIIIHSKQLSYTTTEEHRVVLRGVGGAQPPDIDRTELVELTQYLVVHLKGPLEAGSLYEMDTKFQGELADDLAGFYRSEYMDGDVRKVLATTQMAPSDARKSFPCFDEPSMKASFNITLIHPRDLTALSNMQPRGPSVPLPEDANWSITEFESTPVMSTYLLVFIVSEFTYVESKVIRIWARPSATAEGHGSYALNVTGPILSFFAGHYDTPYPLDKSGELLLPDFNAGAMENWGLVTYRENSLLFDPLSSSSSNKERVVTVIAHELAHQWFGNLVTVAWWNDLWLNEGFASYVEYLGADYAEPTWNLKDLIVVNDVYPVMAVDALASSHPLTTPADEVNTPAQISEMFDSIAYNKGASVLRMLSDFLTEELFKKGLASYLHAFSYQSTTYLDLWEHLQKASGPSISSLLTFCSALGGAPSAQLATPPDRPFALLGSSFQIQVLAPAPASSATSLKSRGVYLVFLFSCVFGLLSSGRLSCPLGCERVAGKRNWKPRGEGSFSMGVLLWGDGVAKSLLMRTLKISVCESQPHGLAPWLHGPDHVRGCVGSRQVRPHLKLFMFSFPQKYLQKQVKPLFEYFQATTSNWTQRPETLMDQYNEINAINTACSNGLSACEDLVSNLFAQWMGDPDNNPIHPNLRSTVYCKAIAQGGEREWGFAWEQFRNATLVNEADKLRTGLACSTQVWILNRYLSYTLNPDLIRKQDATSTIISIANNVVGQTLAWDFIQSNWRKLFLDYGGGSFSFSNLIRGVTRRFSTEYELKQLEKFQADNSDIGFGSGTRALEQALEKTQSNIKWVNENKDEVLRWFTEHTD
uniref:Aminopeptidase n=1 Tax=Equus caballus TaxID=9796 RepID=A0A9L0SI61_HORSE